MISPLRKVTRCSFPRRYTIWGRLQSRACCDEHACEMEKKTFSIQSFTRDKGKWISSEAVSTSWSKKILDLNNKRLSHLEKKAENEALMLGCLRQVTDWEVKLTVPSYHCCQTRVYLLLKSPENEKNIIRPPFIIFSRRQQQTWFPPLAFSPSGLLNFCAVCLPRL